MDINSNSKVMMDFVRLETEVRQKAQEYLDDISEANLKAFAESTKYIAQSILENYFLSVDDIYSNGALKIEDIEVFNKFIDFLTSPTRHPKCLNSQKGALGTAV